MRIKGDGRSALGRREEAARSEAERDRAGLGPGGGDPGYAGVLPDSS